MSDLIAGSVATAFASPTWGRRRALITAGGIGTLFILVSGLLIRGFGVQVHGGAPVPTWGFIAPGHFLCSRFVPMFAPLLGRTDPAIQDLSKTTRPAPDPGAGATRIRPLPPADTDMSWLDHWSRPSLAKADRASSTYSDVVTQCETCW